MTNPYVITLPRLGGVRESATTLAESLPRDLAGSQVVVDAETNLTCSQGFVDELLKQILEIRNTEQVIIVNWNEHLKVYANLSGVKRGYLNQITFR
ncbi:MAG: hypothetical protein H9W81_05805 [Enterococcus sp.]|nr:hypothetical protein [Enterococcus sp.]